jgi:hypothetical protein
MQELNLDALAYGNISREDIDFLNEQTYLDALFSELTTYSFPKNSSNTAKEELNDLVDYTNELISDEQSLARFQRYDSDLNGTLIAFLVKYRVKKDDAVHLVNAINRDCLPLLMKLKFYFQRVRPYQLAYYYKLKLLPFVSYSSHNPSYPSGHALQSQIFAKVVGDKYPSLYKIVNAFAKDIQMSRLFMGTHYQSDIDLSLVIAEKIYENKEFKLKYQL